SRDSCSFVLSLLPCLHSFHRSSFFFFDDTAPTEIYTLSLHDALPISWLPIVLALSVPPLPITATPLATITLPLAWPPLRTNCRPDRKSTRLNSSHVEISYAVFCLKKKKK